MVFNFKNDDIKNKYCHIVKINTDSSRFQTNLSRFMTILRLGKNFGNVIKSIGDS